jgi:hypothetical protein
MTSSEIDERLRELARLSNELLDRADVRRERARLARAARRTASVDMSSDGIDSRLRRLSSVSRLCASLAAGRDQER